MAYKVMAYLVMAYLAMAYQQWPFENVCLTLCHDLLSPAWTIRHGAAIALREIIKTHGSGAGRAVGMTEAEQLQANERWVEDVCVRLLCVLALDRFGDFVSDQVPAACVAAAAHPPARSPTRPPAHPPARLPLFAAARRQLSAAPATTAG